MVAMEIQCHPTAFNEFEMFICKTWWILFDNIVIIIIDEMKDLPAR